MENTSLMEQLTPWIASAVVAILGLVVGRWLERRDADRRWLRDHRLAAYSDVVDAGERIWVLAVNAWTTYTRDDDDTDKDWGEELFEAIVGLHTVIARVVLLGPRPVGMAINEFGDAVKSLGLLCGSKKAVRDAVAEGLAGPAKHPSGQNYRLALDRFSKEAKAVIR